MDNIPQRNFGIGSEWVYYKLYTGPKTADLILTQIIKPMTEEFIKKGFIDKWFFIRYADPKNHLRVRFHCPDKSNLGELISSLHEPLNHFMELDLIWKIQLDTYQRELERYGANTIELSETLFYRDSDSIVQFLDLVEGDEGEQLRWLYGLRSIDHLLDGFKYTLDEKLVLIDGLKTGFGREFGMSRPLKKQLDEMYRKERENIEGFMVFTKEKEPDYEPILSILANKKELLRPVNNLILDFRKRQKLELNLNNLMGSYIHMLMNRLFKSKNRLNEMVCYDFLYRHYRTTMALRKI
ncbi:MAG: thiopeptide-type bacteriocin biosynthesis protein [Saonia sp.]